MKIDPEFKTLIPAMRAEEYAALEQSLLTEGCRDALVVWRQEDILLDGHNRYAICKEHGIDFDCHYLDFDSRYTAKLWIIANQLARRNLTEGQREYLIGERYELEKQEHGGDRKSSDQSGHLIGVTRQLIADEFGVGQGTVQRAAEFKQAIDAIAGHSEEVKDSILAGDLGISRQDIRQLAGVLKKEPEVAHAAIDELVAGNVRSFRHALVVARNGNTPPSTKTLPINWDLLFECIDYGEPYIDQERKAQLIDLKITLAQLRQQFRRPTHADY